MGVVPVPDPTTLGAPSPSGGDDRHVEPFTVVPIPVMDGTVVNADIIVRYCMYFDQRLSLDAIADGWYSLVRHMPILSSRVRQREDAPSGLAFHIPSPEVLQRDAMMDSYLHKEQRQFYALDLPDHSVCEYWPAARRFTTKDSKLENVAFHARAPAHEREQYITALNGVKSFDQLLQSDRPIFTAQATRFNDATIVSISFSHVIGDGFGIKLILKAWSDLVRGKELGQSVAVLPRENFASIDMHTKPDLPSSYVLFGLREKARFLVNMLYDLRISRPESAMESRYIHLPEPFVKDLIKTANEQLYQAGKRSANDRVSRSNVVFAWLAQNLARVQKPSKPFTSVTIINGRGREVEGVAKIDPNEFAGSALAVPLSSAKAGEIASMPLGLLAHKVRHDVEDQATPDNLRKLFALTIHTHTWRRAKMQSPGQAPSNDGKMPFFCPPDHKFWGMTDWRAMRFGDVDFGGACMNGETSAKVKVAHAHQLMPGSVRDRFVCIGEMNGALWLYGTLSKAEWEHKDGFGKLMDLNKAEKRRTSSGMISSRL